MIKKDNLEIEDEPLKHKGRVIGEELLDCCFLNGVTVLSGTELEICLTSLDHLYD